MDGGDAYIAEEHVLSYDDAPYEEQVANAQESNVLMNRISTNKIYLLSETLGSRAGTGKSRTGRLRTVYFLKGRQNEVTNGNEEADVEEDAFIYDETGTVVIRPNAILLQGTPVSHLPTRNIFEYAKHFNATPLGLEWVNDTSCVLVYQSNNSAREAYFSLQASGAQEPSIVDYVVAHPLPQKFWPPGNSTFDALGREEGLRGDILMRMATTDDVKKKGAKRESEFYRKHGEQAGKETAVDHSNGSRGLRKRRRDDDDDEEDRKQMLDEELDSYLANRDSTGETEEDDSHDRPKRDQTRKRRRSSRPLLKDRLRTPEGEDPTALEARLSSYDPLEGITSPPSKMRSDYIHDALPDSPPLSKMRTESILDSPPRSKMRSDYFDEIGRSLLERTSDIRVYDEPPTAVQIRTETWDRSSERPRSGNGHQRLIRPLPHRRDGERGNRSDTKSIARPRKTAEELDAELDAFLNDRS